MNDKTARKLYKKIYKSLENKTDAQKMSVEPILKRLERLEVIISQLIIDTLKDVDNDITKVSDDRLLDIGVYIERRDALLKTLVQANFINPKDYELRTRL